MPAPREIVLDLPVPPSVNLTRKVHWSGHAKMKAWRQQATAEIAIAKSHRQWINLGMCSPLQCFELNIVVPDDFRIDLDNLKAVADYLRRIEVIEDDSPRHMRRLVVEVGDMTSDHIRVTIRPIGSEA